MYGERALTIVEWLRHPTTAGATAATDASEDKLIIDEAYVDAQLGALAKNEDLSRFIL